VDKYLNLTSYYGQQVELDSQGRVLLPLILRGTAKLDAEVAVRGKIFFLQVQNLQKLAESLPANALTTENRQSLATVLKRRS
jgi:MraZ protein